MDLRNWLCTLLAPSFCIFCDSSVVEFRNGTVCEACWSRLEPMRADCLRCGQQYAAGECLECAQCRALPHLDVARSYGLYRAELGIILRRYKYRAERSLAPGLADRLEFAFLRNFGRQGWDLLATVPTHRARIQERGFDHLELLSRLLSKRTRLSFQKVLNKSIASRPQAGLSEKQRRRNVRRTFKASQRLDGRRVLLLDDILTTGATVDECARVLKRAGARTVGVLTVARAE